MVRRERLERARGELQQAATEASASVQTQLESIDSGIFTEESGDTAHDSEPKIDRIVEVNKKLDALTEEAEKQAVKQRMSRAQELLDAYLKNHPDEG